MPSQRACFLPAYHHHNHRRSGHQAILTTKGRSSRREEQYQRHQPPSSASLTLAINSLSHSSAISSPSPPLAPGGIPLSQPHTHTHTESLSISLSLSHTHTPKPTAMTTLSVPSQGGVYASVYTPSFLSMIYDYLVLRFNMRYMWGCPTDKVLLPFFAEGMSRRHLDVGVATGFLPAAVLSRVFRKTAAQHLTLLDINPNPLVAAAARVRAATGARTDIRTVEADVTAPLPAPLLEMVVAAEEGSSSSSGSSGVLVKHHAGSPLYDSISMFNLFHCVPGWPSKLVALRTYKRVLEPTRGVLYGCTVLGERAATGWLSRWYVRLYNRLGVFNNLHDDREGFELALGREFEEFETWVVGMTLLFRATRPRLVDVEDVDEVVANDEAESEEADSDEEEGDDE
ncbi:hypothetical protein RB594_001125 [Gaeumannomyces avenae]